MAADDGGGVVRNRSAVTRNGSRITVAFMVLCLGFFAYEFIARDSAIGSGWPGLPPALVMLTAVCAPMALFFFGGYGVFIGYRFILRRRADKEPLSRGVRILGAWVTTVLLWSSAYLVYQVSVPIDPDDGTPDWIGILILPLGFAALIVALRAVFVTIGVGERRRGDSAPGEPTPTSTDGVSTRTVSSLAEYERGGK